MRAAAWARGNVIAMSAASLDAVLPLLAKDLERAVIAARIIGSVRWRYLDLLGRGPG